MPAKKIRLSVTAGLPFVSVPVLSNITILTRVALSSASAPCSTRAPFTSSHASGQAQPHVQSKVSQPAGRTSALAEVAFQA